MRRVLTALIAGCIVLLPLQAVYIIERGRLAGEDWQYGTTGVYALDALILIFVILSVWSVQRRGTNGRGMIWSIAGMLALTAFFSVYFSERREVSLYHLILLLIGIGLAWGLSRQRMSMRMLGIAFGVSGVIQSCIAVWQFVAQRGFASTILGTALHDPGVLGQAVVETGEGRFLRAYGTFPHPNILAGFLVVAALMVIGWLLVSRSRPERLAAVGAFTILLYGLFLTMSRTGWGALTVALAFLAFCVWYIAPLRQFRRHILVAGVGCVIAFTAFGLVHRDMLMTRITGGTRLETISVEDRALGFRDASELLGRSWLTGVGIGTFTSAVHDDVDGNRPIWQIQPVHNVYALIAVELGIFGALFFLALAAEVLQKLVRRAGREGWQSIEAFIGISAFVSVLLIGLFDHYLWSLHAGVLIFWAVVGICLSFSHEPEGVD